ncbi:Nramp family divalent metal transporter [Acidipila rosea]|uniref:Divalent metal cation transporter MntH n=1 Tax=Acidipila rosea TaxID=768535 RepID=A0A4R1LCN3_9BACT|nr:Nramp family divalent metal transporter [Acidipila rosea]MBW4027184.1 Nramp family divalent metal transporter [Acidobacteriota bacterium]MBW4045761.1 Nramp family divalent metal transporter [Acidobacteriota bacterium]TCK74309.1 manganese transport protein [Acidipila rosea]
MPSETLQVETRSSPSESAGTVHSFANRGLFRHVLGFAGPGFLIAVGYMDPGNWATDLAAGSRYGYSLLFVIMASNLMAVLLQSLSLKLGIATEQDLAQLCRARYRRSVAVSLWVFAEIAIAACDLAEVIGSAIALQLLFGLPLLLGVIVTGLDVLLILLLEGRGFRKLEAVVMVLIGTIAVLFGIEVVLSHPAFGSMVTHLFVPPAGLLRDREMLYIAISILGATVMPHNLYLHSSIVQTRDYPRTREGKRQAVRFANIDSAVALTMALFVNGAILVVAAAVFHKAHPEVAEIGDAYKLLTPLLGVTGASTIFALALLASGQNSTITGTLAGQIVMEGFLDLKMKPWLRRLITRGMAIVPAVIVTAIYGSDGTARLLVFSQVVLSMQLSFAVVPLVAFTGNRELMGSLVNRRWLQGMAWAVAALIAVLNGWLLLQMIHPQ